jgi:hypothetical protein
MTEQIVCPVREDLSEKPDECPCQEDWVPTPNQLKKILKAHAGIHVDKRPDWATLCNSDLRRANLKGAELQKANLQSARLASANLEGADLLEANLFEADLNNANLRGADLGLADLRGTNFFAANLEETDLRGANLQGADLRQATLDRAYPCDANLQAANLRGATLRGAVLCWGTNVEDARMAHVDLLEAMYAPASHPPDVYVEGITGLSTVTFPQGGVSGLVQLRELLRKAGLRDLERQATFAIEHGKARHARCDLTQLELTPFFSPIDPPEPEESARAISECEERTTVIDKFGSWLKLIFFEWTTGWGLYPGRAVSIILWLILGLTVVYAVPIAMHPGVTSNRHGVFRVWPKDRLESCEAGITAAVNIRVDRVTASIPASIVWAFYFSVLSAFHFGWRDLNIGTWISRIQSTEFSLRGRGWVRVVAGLQSLISMYLLAMWVLTYFGRPFQ